MPGSYTIGTAVRSTGVGVAGMYAQLAGVTTKFVGTGAANSAASAQHWAQVAAQQPSTYNRVNASASQAITAALQGVAGLGAATTKLFAGIAQAFAGGAR